MQWFFWQSARYGTRVQHSVNIMSEPIQIEEIVGTTSQERIPR